MSCWNFPLTPQSYKLYAISHYGNGRAYWHEFFTDLKTMVSVSRMIYRIKLGTPPSHLLNTLIRLGNRFKSESLARLLFYMSPEENYTELKTYLSFISRLPDEIPECNLSSVPINTELFNLLDTL